MRTREEILNKLRIKRSWRDTTIIRYDNESEDHYKYRMLKYARQVTRMNEKTVKHYLQKLIELHEEAKNNIIVKDELYESFMINLHQCILFGQQDLKHNKNP